MQFRIQPIRAAQRAFATPRIRRASRARDAGDWPGAAEGFAAALRICGRSPKVWVQYGHALKESGALASAEAAYRRAAKLDPDHADAHLHRAGLLTRLGRPDQAVQSYRRVLRLGAGTASTWVQYGHALKESGDPAAAEAAYRGAAEIDPDHADAHLHLAGLLARRGRPDQAVESYRTVLRLGGGPAPQVWVQYGHALMECGVPASAEAAYRRAAEIDPDHADAYFHLAGLLNLLGRPAEAAQAYRRLLQLEPGSADVRMALERAELTARPDPVPLTPWRALDPRWQNALEATLPHLRPDDRMLVPEGDWPPLPCPARRYGHVLEVGDATTILLRKDRVCGLPKPEADRLLKTWQCLHADGVILAFATRRPGAPEMRDGLERYHLEPLETYVDSRALKKRRGTVYFLHLPKTGGTSFWKAFASAFPANAAYSSEDAFEANPPAPGDYDAVLVHGIFWPLARLLTPEDLVVVLMREPTARFASLVMHSRRASLDPLTLNPVMTSIRDGPLEAFLNSEDARPEILKQLFSLGADGRADPAEVPPETLLERALAVIRRPDVIAAPTDEMASLIERLAPLLGFPKRPAPLLNTCDDAERAASAAELEAARAHIEAVNAPERVLYDEVRRRFAAWRAAQDRERAATRQ